MKKEILISIFFLLSLAVINCQSKDSLIKDLNKIGWNPVGCFLKGSDKWHHYNRSDQAWKVELVQDCLRTSSFSENNVVFYLLSDGYVKGIDNGEWGGRLVFFPTDVRENEYIIINDNIIAIFSINNNIYVLGGTSHQGVSMGHIYKLYKKNGKWNSYEVLDLKDKPYAYVINNYELYIVTYSKLMRIVNERIKDIIVENAFWQSLYPNSIVVFKNNAIIGMRGGITTVNLENKEIISFEKQ